jgi:hypothetical protein
MQSPLPRTKAEKAYHRHRKMEVMNFKLSRQIVAMRIARSSDTAEAPRTVLQSLIAL